MLVVLFLTSVGGIVAGIVMLVRHGRSKPDGEEASVSRKRGLVSGVALLVAGCVLGGVFFSGLANGKRDLFKNDDVNAILGGGSYDAPANGAFDSTGAGRPPSDSAAKSESFSADAMQSEPSDTVVGSATAREPGFVRAAEEPVSTLSADADTASWDRVADCASRGIAVSPGEVRIEEMLNHFDYGYAEPSDADGFAITRTVAPCPWNEGSYLLAIGYATRKPVVVDAPLNLTLLVDVSGSMNDSDKMGLLKRVMPGFVESLGEDDRVSLVTYSGEERLVLDGVSGADHDTILKAIDGLAPGGVTNGEAGINMAYDVARKNFSDGGVNRVVMVTDGDLNVGAQTPAELEALVSEKAHGGIYLSVIGVGLSASGSDAKMESLADHGDGIYRHMADEEAGKRILGTELMCDMVPFADDVKSQVSFNAAEVESYRLIGYGNRTLETQDFHDDAVDAAELGPGAQFTVLYEVVPTETVGMADASVLPEGVAFSRGQLADVGVRWKAALDGGSVREVHDAVMVSDVTDSPSDDWRLAAAVTELGMMLSGSEFVGTSSYASIEEVLGGPAKVEGLIGPGTVDEFRNVASMLARSGAIS